MYVSQRFTCEGKPMQFPEVRDMSRKRRTTVIT